MGRHYPQPKKELFLLHCQVDDGSDTDSGVFISFDNLGWKNRAACLHFVHNFLSIVPTDFGFPGDVGDGRIVVAIVAHEIQKDASYS
jgi:hypothetical protein